MRRPRGGYPAPPYSGPLPKVPTGAAPGSARREPALRYQWGADCTCGDRIRIESSTPQPISDLAAVWWQQHPDGHNHGGTMTTTEPDRQPSQPGQALRERLADAKRHLFAHIIASAHLLDTPFTNAPESPWSRMKHAMEGLDAAIAELDAAPASYTMPAEPPETVTELWDRDGDRWYRSDDTDTPDGWVPDTADGIWDWAEVVAEYGPLSSVPPEPTEGGTDA